MNAVVKAIAIDCAIFISSGRVSIVLLRVAEPNRQEEIGAKRIGEELGDIIWYSATVARRAGIDFEKTILLENLRRIQNRPDAYLPSVGVTEVSKTALGDHIATEGLRAVTVQFSKT